MKTLLLTSFLLLIAFYAPTRVIQPIAQLEMHERFVEPGQTVTVPLLIASNVPVTSISVGIEFTPSLLSYESFALGPDFTDQISGSYHVNATQASSGKLFLSITPGAPGFPSGHNNIVWLLTFRAFGTNTGNRPIRFSDFNNIIRTTTGTEIGATFANGRVYIIPIGTGRRLSITPKTAQIGAMETFSVRLASLGNENAVGFSVAYDRYRMAFDGATAGFDSTGASLLVNHQETGFAGGKIGVAIALSAGQEYPQGDREIAILRFRILGQGFSLSAETPLTFFNSPIAPEAATITASAHSITFEQPNIQVQTSVEGDVAPRTSGNFTTTIADWVQVGRFAAFLDTATPGVEFQKADCSPKETRGNGQIGLSDWVQAGRFAAGLDLPQATGGPTSFTPGFSFESAPNVVQRLDLVPRPEHIPDQARRVLLSQISTRGDELLYAVTLNGRGDENALAFSIEFDSGAMTFQSAEAGRGDAQLLVNGVNVGRIGVVMALQPGQAFGAGENQMLVLKFKKTGSKAETPRFIDLPVKCEVATVTADELPTVFGTEAMRSIRSVSQEPVYEMGKDGVGHVKITHKEKIQLSERMIQPNIRGVVVLSAIFRANGTVTDIKVIRGMPDGIAERAVDAASKTRFIPAMRNGSPVSARGYFEYMVSSY